MSKFGLEVVQITCSCAATLHAHQPRCLFSSSSLKRRTSRLSNFAPRPATRVAAPENKSVYALKKRHDGKQNRPKAKKLPAPTSDTSRSNGDANAASTNGGCSPKKSSQPPPPPPRVDPTINIPVRKQIQWVKASKSQAETPSSKPAVRQRYSKKTYSTPEEFKEQRKAEEERVAELSKQESKNFALRQLYNTALPPADKFFASSRMRAAAPPPVLLVDGYNVLFKWKAAADFRSSQHHQQQQHDNFQDSQLHLLPSEASIKLADGRDALLEALGTYSQIRQIRVVVAFDAMNAAASGMVGAGCLREETLSSGVTVVWCGDREADTFIESQVSVWLERRHPYVVVATSDSLQRTVVESNAVKTLSKIQNKAVCHVVPASGLIKELEATQREVMEQVEKYRLQQGPGMHLLGSAVKAKDKDAFNTLHELRRGLYDANGGWKNIDSSNGNGSNEQHTPEDN